MPQTKPQIVTIPKIQDRRGNLSVITTGETVSFDIARAYWIHDIVTGEVRYGHAFRQASELIVALSGSFEVSTECAGGKSVFMLNRPDRGLYLPPLTWREISDTSSNAVALVVTSTSYSADDYIRDYDIYKQIIVQVQ